MTDPNVLERILILIIVLVCRVNLNLFFPESIEKERLERTLEQEDINKALDEDTLERLQRELVDKKEPGMEDSYGGDEAKYSPEEKSYKEDKDEELEETSDKEISLSPSEESEEEEGMWWFIYFGKHQMNEPCCAFIREIVMRFSIFFSFHRYQKECS